jgi:anti-sigma28 factor (negative regulator of flagellin synthesis)
MITMKINNQEIYTNISRQKLEDVPDKQIETNQGKKTSPNVDKIEISHVAPNKENTDRNKIPSEIEMAKQDIINEIKEHPDIKKYQTIKEQVQSGNYEVDTEETAKAILRKGHFDKLV